MSLLDTLWGGAKALIQGVTSAAREVVRAVFEEIDRSSIGRATTQLIHGFTRQHFGTAKDLVDEERELAEKRARDGRLREVDLERLQAIEAERDNLRKQLEAAKAAEAAKELRQAGDELIAANMSADEAASAVGILASKTCECGGTMRIVQGRFDAKHGKQTFFWQCTVPRAVACKTVTLNPEAEKATVLRQADPDLDGAHATRRAIWERQDVLAKAHGRLRQGLGDDDEEVICPTHLLPMKLMPKPSASGRMLDSYHYICLGVHADGRACSHTVDVKSFPQVAATLKRRDGVGIIGA